MSKAATLANIASGEAFTIDESNERIGIASTAPSASVDVNQVILLDGNSGVVTATKFVGDGSSLTSITASGLTGTPSITVQDIIAVGATFSGVLTYEDVTNVDAIGIITARSGVAYGTGIGATISSPATNTLALGTNGAERVRVTSAGKVGIGSVIPSELLSIMADGPCGIELKDSGHGIVATTIKIGNTGKDLSVTVPEDVNYTLTNGNYKVTTGGTERIRITSAGVIDVNGGDVDLCGATAGITSAKWDASANRLELYDNVTATFGDSSDLIIYHDGSVNVIDSASANLEIKHGGEKLAAFAQDGQAELYFDASKKFETTNAGVTITGVTTSTTGIHAGPGILRENMRGYGSAMNGAYTADILSTGMVLNAPTNSTATFTINLRGNGSTTFNSLMNSGESTVFTAFVGQNNSSYYLTDFQIDGSSITEEWAGGTAPSAGGASGTDIYTFTILKTANATFSVFANVTNFA